MKLVRHRLPDIAAARGKPMRTALITDPTELRALLAAKLVEEATEFKDAPSIDELADVFETMQCLLVAHGWSSQLLEGRWAHARRERGGLLRGSLALGATAYLGDPLPAETRVTIIHDVYQDPNTGSRLPARALRAMVTRDKSGHVDPERFQWTTIAEDGPWKIGSDAYNTEGITWARGWDEETAGALLAAYALKDATP